MSLLGVIALVLQILRGVLAGLNVDPKFADIAASVQAAVDALQGAHDEVITKEHLESLRTVPKW